MVLDQDDFRPDRRIEARPALPSEYLWRLGLQNVLFEDRIRIAAIGSTIYGTPSIHTTQPWLSGAAPEIETVRAFMVAAGFRGTLVAILLRSPAREIRQMPAYEWQSE